MSDKCSGTWRLIVEDEPRSGAANMAVDEAIAIATAEGRVPPTLRFYRWEPPAVSLGRHQSAADIDQKQVYALGYELVRRTTGGRAILHTDELTYSVAASMKEPLMEGGVMDAYLRLSNGLLSGLQQIGLAVEKAGGDVRAGPDVSAACFEVPSAYEITASGRKLMGSAQSRRQGYVLQHGTLPLIGDIARLVDVLSLDETRAQALRRHLERRACTLAQALQVPEDSSLLDFRTVADAMSNGFAEALELKLEPGSLTPEEIRASAELIRQQYANAEWTFRR